MEHKLKQLSVCCNVDFQYFILKYLKILFLNYQNDTNSVDCPYFFNRKYTQNMA